MDKKELENSLKLRPNFSDDGLIPCITTCAESGDVLMFAFMNEEALNKSIETGEAYYWSRSRKELWHKGASSGFIQKIIQMRTDCDQDCIWIKVQVTSVSEKAKAACHTGRKSCFYREIRLKCNDRDMSFIDAERLFDPDDVYKTKS